jgi:hypothetical protein
LHLFFHNFFLNTLLYQHLLINFFSISIFTLLQKNTKRFLHLQETSKLIFSMFLYNISFNFVLIHFIINKIPWKFLKCSHLTIRPRTFSKYTSPSHTSVITHMCQESQKSQIKNSNLPLLGHQFTKPLNPNLSL